ncbi:MAG: Beta-galactosidase C-terminal domain, partial [Ruminococcus sp.]|nr:Beta-galactosidase C-terminal domain [Candidatus Copronaster equi]
GTAEKIAEYSLGRLKGTPAVTVNKYGRGKAVLYGFNGCNVYFYEAFAKNLKELLSINPLIGADDGVLVSSRTDGENEYLFCINMKDSEVKIYPEVPMSDLLANKKAYKEYTLKPYQTAVLKSAE